MEIKVTADLLDGLVLALLDKQDYYGYALTQDMQTAISISESTMYPVLRRLQKNNYLTTYDQPYQGRNRRYYRLRLKGGHIWKGFARCGEISKRVWTLYFTKRILS